jgi:hypothetical protein
VTGIRVSVIRVILEKLQFGRHARQCFFSVLLLATAFNGWGRVVPDTGDPLGFFTTVADKMLRSTFPFGVTNIPVCSNGVYVYTPAVQRLLQLSANIYDAANTNAFPVVFRPLFAKDAATNIFIIGYQQVTNVSGASDPQLSPPYDVTQLSGALTTPIADAYGPVNVYGVPWIIGAKKGLPGFNQLSMITSAQVTRKLEVVRTTTDPATATYSTNQMYVIGISNSVGISFWNSYSNAYPRPLTVYAQDLLSMTLTNNVNVWSGSTNLTINNLPVGVGYTIPIWPGSHWSGTPPNALPQANSFFINNWGFYFLSPSVYRFNSATFDPVGSPSSSQWETTSTLAQLPPFGLAITNYLQVFILDGNNVIDYVQLQKLVSNGNLNQALADPDYPSPLSPNTYFQWSTNLYRFPDPVLPTWGVVNQLWVSGHTVSAPAAGGQWSTAPTVIPGDTTPPAEAAYFNGFFVPYFHYNGQTYVNSQLAIQAPYTPTRIIYSSFLLQANDPLIHYLASDLNSQIGAPAVWATRAVQVQNGLWYRSDDSIIQPLPTPPTTPIGGRYQPWGQNGQLSRIFNVDTNAYNLAFRDPLVWWSDSWNFPTTNLVPSLGGLGQVHRGTPWQSIYLKSTNILFGKNSLNQNIGTNTWANWTGDIQRDSLSGQYLDAALMAPVNDWRLASLLMPLLNTNDATQLFSVNDANIADWQNVLNGLIVYSNSAAVVFPTVPPTFDTYVMASNSSQTLTVAAGIANARASQPNPSFYSIGDVLAAPELTVNSPWLNTINSQQLKYGITDAAYEAIPAQLLPLLRTDSIGTLAPTNGGWNLSFSGADGYAYALQTSTNLVDWSSVSTNSPVQGGFIVPVSPSAGSQNQFFRSMLLP